MEIIILVVVIIAIILFKVNNVRVVWWEYLLLFGGSIVLYLFIRFICISIITSDTEYWGGYITKTTYYEPWNEEVEVTRTRVGSDGEEETYTTTETEYHSEKYTYNTNLRGSSEIPCTRNRHEEIKRLFGTYPKFKDMHRDYHTEDGDAYEYYWNGSDATMYTITEKHLYKNPMKGSGSIFKLQGDDDDGLYDYPEIVRDDQRTILGIKKTLSDQRLRVLNSKLGKDYQIRIFLLVFPDKYGIDKAIDQRNYWEGGNKNELVVCIGVKNDSVTWCYPFSWCDNTTVEAKVKSWYIENPKFDIVSFCDFLEPVIKKYWVRKKFSDFNYITTELLGYHNLILFSLVLVWIILVSYWIYTDKLKNLNR